MYYGEKFNAATHLVGATLALPGAVVLVVLAGCGDSRSLAACLTFGQGAGREYWLWRSTS